MSDKKTAVAEDELKGMDVAEYINSIHKHQERKKELEELSLKDLDIIYNKLQDDKKILCKDRVNKDEKINRILSTEYGFTYRGIRLNKDVFDIMQKDWEYSNKKDAEVFRLLCLDEKTNKVSITDDKSRVEGEVGTGAVQPKWDLCDLSFPGKGTKVLGSVHTHPSFRDKPLESLGDVMVFSMSEQESYSCTITKWGTLCMFRKKEPAFIYDVPKIEKGKEGKDSPVYDDEGKLVYEVKSDVVDWERARRFSTQQLSDSVYHGSLGRGNFGQLGHVPWYPPEGIESSSVGVVEQPFEYGMERSKPGEANNLYCESFYEWYANEIGKIRTVCNNGAYVESSMNPILWMFDGKGFSSNFYYEKDIEPKITKKQINKEESKYLNTRKPDSPGFFKTIHEARSDIMEIDPAVKILKAGSIYIDGNAYCEYLLTPSSGDPRGLMCRKMPKYADKKICVMT